jgi:hypothetical protein
LVRRRPLSSEPSRDSAEVADLDDLVAIDIIPKPKNPAAATADESYDDFPTSDGGILQGAPHDGGLTAKSKLGVRKATSDQPCGRNNGIGRTVFSAANFSSAQQWLAAKIGTRSEPGSDGHTLEVRYEIASASL